MCVCVCVCVCVCLVYIYLHVADSSLLEGAVLQVVGADVTIFTPVTRKHTADTGSTPEREREREKEEGGRERERLKCPSSNLVD